MTTRSMVLAAIVLVAVIVAGVFGYRAFSGSNGASASADGAMPARDGFEQELIDAVPAEDTRAIGDPNAPVVIVEYASLSCSHCANFHETVYPQLKETYIDTGKVFYILRPAAFDPVATAGFMLAACAGPERYFNFIDVLFDKQAEWVFVEQPMNELRKIAKQGGFTDESFDACMNDQAAYEGIAKATESGYREFNVRSTPTFFINGEKVEGEYPWSEFQPMVEKALPNN